MERTINKIVLGFAAVFLAACGGSGSGGGPDLSEAVATQTIVMQPSWPELLQSSVSQYNLQASLKGEDSQGKAVGEVGPVSAESEGSNYQFVFSLPSGLSPSADLTINIFWNAESFSEDCRRVAVIQKPVEMSGATITLAVAADEFSVAQDCDGDGLENIREFLAGLQVDNPDSDGDGAADGADLFPLDPLEWADADGDGIGDNRDNCAAASNAAQDDLDGDGLGDFCDPDRDGDGLSNNQEISMGLNPDSADTDGDGVLDGADNCPAVANGGQENADGDPLGDLCDCDPADGRRYQTAEDEPDAEYLDSNCDGVDGTAVNAVFVSPRGDDVNSGSPRSPLLTLTRAYRQASEGGLDVYVEAGTYSVDDLNPTEGVRFFGGYRTEVSSEPFGFRCIYPTACAEVAVLDGTGDFLLEQTGGVFFFDGFRVDVPLILREAEAAFQNNRMEQGVVIDNADDVSLVNNIIRAGEGRIAAAIEILGSSPRVSNNTVDATNRYDVADSSTARTAVALIVDNALGLDLQGNLLITGGAENQYGFFCRGLEPAPDGVTGNLFALFPLDGASAGTLPRSVSCRGEFDFAAADGLDLGFQNAAGNFDYPSGRTFTDLLDVVTYEILDPGYEAFGAR
ncbi:MAG: thrombospondin type 3 repeat-containing protein [Deltaproteobacteria bacterium]|nr:thrombospondin type 3 repeat-containing protein [Deltaproteobacteria bacterium]